MTNHPSGAWCCPHCKNRCKTLSGINRHLYREHGGEGFGIYFTAMELKSLKEKRTSRPSNLEGDLSEATAATINSLRQAFQRGS